MTAAASGRFFFGDIVSGDSARPRDFLSHARPNVRETCQKIAGFRKFPQQIEIESEQNLHPFASRNRQLFELAA
jgi:hypothetical protein